MARKNHQEIDYHYNLKLYLSLLFKYKFLFTILLLTIFLSETAALVDTFLFKEIIDQGTAFLNNLISQQQIVKIFIIIAIIFLSVSLFHAVLKWAYIHLATIMEARLMTELKKKFFHHILSLSYRFHTTHRTGSLISRLIRGGRAMESMTDILLFNIAPLVFQTAIISGSLLYFSKRTVIVVICTITLYILYSYYIQRVQNNYSIVANDAEDAEKASISDFFTNIESIKYFGKEASVKQKFDRIAENTMVQYIRYWNFYRWLDSGQFVILTLGTFFVVYFPLQSFLAGALSLGTLAFIYTAYASLLPSLFSFVRGMREYFKIMADFESLFTYAKIKNEIKDKRKAKSLEVKEGRIEFKNVYFKYQKRKIFHNFSLALNKEQKVALVGPSGSGKTTLVKLLYRLYDINYGEIFIDGRNIKDVKQESLRSELSIVPQECVLFDDTIYNNVAFSNPKATKKQVLQAMKFAHLDKVIKQSPQKENTVVGERGVRLSGGEKQRVSIARAILANKKILILDEATSALDSRTEHEIQQDLERLMKKRTTIIIAHRLSTIMKADKIVVMEKGRIVQIGKHKELIGLDGLYNKLWNLQKGGYIK